MKSKILAVVILCLLFAGISIAQEGPPHRKDGEKPNPEEMVKKEMKMLKKELELTESQEAFVKKILDESAQKMKALMESGSKDFDEMEKLKEDKDTKLKSVLTDEQWEKYKKFKDRRKDGFRDNDRPPRKER